LYFFNNAEELVKRGTGPYFYLPKMESHLEARLWNDVFNLAQDYIGMKRGTIRGTVLIETIPAAFEMDEVSYTGILLDRSTFDNRSNRSYTSSATTLLASTAAAGTTSSLSSSASVRTQTSCYQIAAA